MSMYRTDSARGGLGGLLEKVARVGSQVGQINREGSTRTSVTKRTTRLSRKDSLTGIEALAPMKTVKSIGFDSGDDLPPLKSRSRSPASRSPSPPPRASSPVPFQPLNNFECKPGAKITAHSLRKMTELNGCVGKVLDNNQKDNRVMVDFAPHATGRMLMRCTNLFLGEVPRSKLTAAQKGRPESPAGGGEGSSRTPSPAPSRGRRGSSPPPRDDKDRHGRSRRDSRRGSSPAPAKKDAGKQRQESEKLSLALTGHVMLGMEVEVTGLQQNTVFNGLRGQVIDDNVDGDGRVLVELPPPHGRKTIAPSNLIPYTAGHDLDFYSNGTAVEAHGLQKDMALNGKKGVVIDDTGDERVLIDFGVHGRRALRAENLRPASARVEHNIEYISPTILQWFRPCFKVTKVVKVGMIERKEPRYWVVDFFRKRLWRPSDCKTATEAIRVISGNDPTTKYHPISEVFKLESDPENTSRLDLRIARVDHSFELNFSDAAERQRFIECVKTLRMDLIWSPFFTMNSPMTKPLLIKVRGEHGRVPIAGGKREETQRLSGETRLNATTHPTVDTKAWVGVLELGEKKSLGKNYDLSTWLDPAVDADIAVVAVTKYAMAPEVERNPDLKISKLIADRLKEFGFSQLLSTEIVGGKKSVIIVTYIKRHLAVQCTNPSVWTGIHQQTFKGKGFLAKTHAISTDLVKVSFHLRETSMCFVALDLFGVAQGTGEDAIEQRNQVLKTLLGKLDAGDAGFTGDAVERYDHVIVLGGIGHGYRGDASMVDWSKHASDIPRGDDCLGRELMKNHLLTGFSEGDLKLNDVHRQGCLDYRILWRTRSLLAAAHKHYESYCLEDGLRAVSSTTTFQTEVLYCEAFSHPGPIRRITVEDCAYRPSQSPGKMPGRIHLVCHTTFTTKQLVQTKDLRYKPDVNKYTQGAFPSLVPINHGYQYLKRRRILVTAQDDKGEIIGSASLSIADAVRAPGKGVKFKRALKRGGVDVENSSYVEGTIKVTEDRSHLKEIQQNLRLQFKDAMTRLNEEEALGRQQIMKEEKVGVQPIREIAARNRKDKEEQLQKQAKQARAELKALTPLEDSRRGVVLDEEHAGRMEILKAMRQSHMRAHHSERRHSFVAKETRAREIQALQQAEAFMHLTWKEVHRFAMYKEEAQLREAIAIEEELERDQLAEEEAARAHAIRRKEQEIEAQKASEKRQVDVEEHLARTKILEEEEDACYELECAMHAAAETAHRRRADRIKREQMRVYQLVTDEAAGRHVIEQAEIAEWNKLRARFFDQIQGSHRAERKAFGKIETQRREAIIAREETFWSNLRAQEMAAWRKATREMTRITPRASSPGAAGAGALPLRRPMGGSRSPSPHAYQSNLSSPGDRIPDPSDEPTFWQPGHGPHGPYTALDHSDVDGDRSPTPLLRGSSSPEDPRGESEGRYPSYLRDKNRGWSVPLSQGDPSEAGQYYYGSPPYNATATPSPPRGRSVARSLPSATPSRGRSEGLENLRENVSRGSSYAYAQVSPLHAPDARGGEGGAPLNEDLLDMLKKADQALARVEWSTNEAAKDDLHATPVDSMRRSGSEASDPSQVGSQISTKAGYDDGLRRQQQQPSRSARREPSTATAGGDPRCTQCGRGDQPPASLHRHPSQRSNGSHSPHAIGRTRSVGGGGTATTGTPSQRSLLQPQRSRSRLERDGGGNSGSSRPQTPVGDRNGDHVPAPATPVTPSDMDALKSELAALRESVERSAQQQQAQQRLFEEQMRQQQHAAHDRQQKEHDAYQHELRLLRLQHEGFAAETERERRFRSRQGSLLAIEDAHALLPPLNPPPLSIEDVRPASPHPPSRNRSPSPEYLSSNDAHVQGDAYFDQLDHEPARWRNLPMLDEHEMHEVQSPRESPRRIRGGGYAPVDLYDTRAAPVSPLTPPGAVVWDEHERVDALPHTRTPPQMHLVESVEHEVPGDTGGRFIFPLSASGAAVRSSPVVCSPPRKANSGGDRMSLLHAALNRVSRVKQQSRRVSPPAPRGERPERGGRAHSNNSPHRSPIRQRNPSAISVHLPPPAGILPLGDSPLQSPARANSTLTAQSTASSFHEPGTFVTTSPLRQREIATPPLTPGQGNLGGFSGNLHAPPPPPPPQVEAVTRSPALFSPFSRKAKGGGDGRRGKQSRSVSPGLDAPAYTVYPAAARQWYAGSYAD